MKLEVTVNNKHDELLGSGELNLYKEVFIKRERNLKKWVAIISSPNSQKVSELMAKMPGASNQMRLMLRISINYNGRPKEATEPNPIIDDIKSKFN